MSLLSRRDPTMYGEHHCHKCFADARYIHQNTHWCRTCLDQEQYPELAHLTQDEREQMRRDAVQNARPRSVVSAGPLTTAGFLG